MGVSLYRVAEQCRMVLEKRVPLQALIPAVVDAYGIIAKKQWYENSAQDTQEIDGSFISTFNSLTPVLDTDRDLYYLTLPSTYLILPHEIGVVWVSLMQKENPITKIREIIN